ncbi:MAG TPA: zinc ribbon domain-containing protein [Acidimicrobiales bacterium]|jgi:putative FmdB family regulatory protein|nr:zinc ribbon domain-containing protein [Acidimicrobiales bacterium]
MPVYDFRCPSCEARFEVQRSIADFDQPTSCPQGHEGAVRVITTWGVTGGVRYGSPAAAARKGKILPKAEEPTPKVDPLP